MSKFEALGRKFCVSFTMQIDFSDFLISISNVCVQGNIFNDDTKFYNPKISKFLVIRICFEILIAFILEQLANQLLDFTHER